MSKNGQNHAVKSTPRHRTLSVSSHLSKLATWGHPPNLERPRKCRPTLCLEEVKWNSLQKSFMTTIKIPSSLRISLNLALAIKSFLVWGVCCFGREALCSLSFLRYVLLSDFCLALYCFYNLLINVEKSPLAPRTLQLKPYFTYATFSTSPSV